MTQIINQSQYLIVVLGEVKNRIFEYSSTAEYLLNAVNEKYPNYVLSELVSEFRLRKRKLMNTLIDVIFFLEQGSQKSQALNEEIKKIIETVLKSEFETANKMLEEYKHE